MKNFIPKNTKKKYKKIGGSSLLKSSLKSSVKLFSKNSKKGFKSVNIMLLKKDYIVFWYESELKYGKIRNEVDNTSENIQVYINNDTPNISVNKNKIIAWMTMSNNEKLKNLIIKKIKESGFNKDTPLPNLKEVKKLIKADQVVTIYKNIDYKKNDIVYLFKNNETQMGTIIEDIKQPDNINLDANGAINNAVNYKNIKININGTTTDIEESQIRGWVRFKEPTVSSGAVPTSSLETSLGTTSSLAPTTSSLGTTTSKSVTSPTSTLTNEQIVLKTLASLNKNTPEMKEQIKQFYNLMTEIKKNKSIKVNNTVNINKTQKIQVVPEISSTSLGTPVKPELNQQLLSGQPSSSTPAEKLLGSNQQLLPEQPASSTLAVTSSEPVAGTSSGINQQPASIIPVIASSEPVVGTSSGLNQQPASSEPVAGTSSGLNQQLVSSEPVVGTSSGLNQQPASSSETQSAVPEEEKDPKLRLNNLINENKKAQQIKLNTANLNPQSVVTQNNFKKLDELREKEKSIFSPSKQLSP